MKNPFQSYAFSELKRQAQLHQGLTELAKTALPLELQQFVVGADIDKDRLICTIQQTPLANKLRFFEAEILGVFNTNMPHLRLVKVQLKTQLSYSPTPLPKRKANLPDETAAQKMREMSEQLEDPQLAEALQRLASLQK